MAEMIDKIASEIISKKTAWESARTGKTSSWRKYYKSWRLMEDETETILNGRSRIQVPAAKNAINTAIDNIFNMVFGVDDFFDVRGRQQIDEDKAAILKAYITYLFGRENLSSKGHNFLTEMCVYGTAIGRVRINTKTDKSIIRKEKTFFGIPTGYETILEEKKINRPDFEHISIFDFFINPTAKDIEMAEGCIIRTEKSIQELEKLQRHGILSGIAQLKKDNTVSVVDTEKQFRLNASGLSAGETKDIEVLEYYGWMDEKVLRESGFKGKIEDGGAEIFAIIADGKTLKCVNNVLLTKERPFVKVCFENVPNEFYGMGICELTESALAGLNATVRQRIDNKTLAINTVFAIDTNTLVPGQELELYPGKIFLFNGNASEGIKQIGIGDVTQGSYREAQEFERYIQDAASITKIAGGVAASKEQSATESNILMQQSSVRLKITTQSVENDFIKPLLRFYYQMIVQFLDVKEVASVQNKDGTESILELTAEDIIGDYDFIPMGTSAMASAGTVGKLIEFLSRTANPYDAQIVNRPYLTKKIYELLGFKDADKAVKDIPPEEMMANAAALPTTGSQPGMTSPALGTGGAGGE